MSWNYRLVLLHKDEYETVYGICEVYYDEDGNPNGRTDPVPVISDNPAATIKMMQLALKKPILNLNLQEMLDN